MMSPIMDHSGLIALDRDHVKNRQKERTQIPGNALAFKLDPKSNGKRHAGDSTEARSIVRGQVSSGSFRLGG